MTPEALKESCDILAKQVVSLTAERDAILKDRRECIDYWGQRCEKAEAERDRLWAALGEIAVLGVQGMKPNYSEWLTFHDKVAQIACRALEQKQ